MPTGPKTPKRAGTSKKLLQLLGEDVAPSTKPWYLMPGYGEKDLLMTPDGEVRGGTLPALVERLTYHYAVGELT